MKNYDLKRYIDIIINTLVLIGIIYIANIGIKPLPSNAKWFITTLSTFVYIAWVYFFVKGDYEKSFKITKINLFFGLFILILFAIFSFAMFKDLIEENGIENTLNSYEHFGKVIYFAICFLQPIILPLPEPLTITAGNIVFGKVIGYILGFSGTILGIITMFVIARFSKNKFNLNLINSKNLEKYNNLVSKNETFILFLLFIFPILPDEVICIGAGLSPIKFKKFAFVALLSKFITIGIYSLSSGVVKEILELGLGYQLIIVTVIVLVFMGIKKLISYIKKKGITSK